MEQLKAAIVSHNCALIVSLAQLTAATGDGVHGTWLLGSVEQVTSGAVAGVLLAAIALSAIHCAGVRQLRSAERHTIINSCAR